MNPAVRSLLLILLSAALSSAGQTYLKLGLTGSEAGTESSAFGFVRAAFGSWQVWVGLTLFAASVLIWMRVLSTTQLSWGYPLLGLSYVFVALLGWLVFQEQLGPTRLIGIALVIAGAALIAQS